MEIPYDGKIQSYQTNSPNLRVDLETQEVQDLLVSFKNSHLKYLMLKTIFFNFDPNKFPNHLTKITKIKILTVFEYPICYLSIWIFI